MLDSIKKALRISHDLLDDEIAEAISAGQNELVRAGIDDDMAFSDDVLIRQALKTYCLKCFSNNKDMSERYDKSFECQLENLRKSSRYMKEDYDV